MRQRSELAPATVPVELTEGGVAVEYLDGRETFYHGVPGRREGELRVPPGKELHLLVTDPDGTEGVLFYVNDRRTSDDVLEDSGVGRLVVADGEVRQPFPGVEVERDGHAHVVTADPDAVEGRTFVFAEDEFEELSYELV